MGFSPSPHHLHQVLVDIFAVIYRKDVYELPLVIDTVDNPIVAVADAVPVLLTRAYLLASVGSRVNLKLIDTIENFLIVVRGTLANVLQHLLKVERAAVSGF